MASPHQSVYLALPQLSADALTLGLDAVKRSLSPKSTRPACELDKHYCNCFLCVTENPEIYDTIRDLIPDPGYWVVEEAHFDVVYSIILDYNNGDPSNNGDLECPPLAWLKRIWERGQRSLEVALQGGWSQTTILKF